MRTSRTPLNFSLALLISCCAFTVQAQIFQPRLRWKEGDPQKVKAILVRVWTYAGRINTLQGSENAEFLSNALQKAVDTVRPITLEDWSSNFHYCPVYFFVDTAIENVLSYQFKGTLLDENMQPVSNPVLAEGDTAFFIASSDPWLTVFNHHLIRLPDHIPNGIRHDGEWIRSKSNGNRYHYRSRAFRFGYTGQAYAYNDRLKQYYATYRPERKE